MSFAELLECSTEIIEEEKAGSGRPVIGTLCSYVPVEILHSFGILPVRLWGQAEDVEKADSLLQPYICPPVRNLMARALEGRHDFLDGIVHCYTCDATCGLYNIWVRNLAPSFHHMVSLPYMAIDEARAYAVAEFDILIEKLEEFTGSEFSINRFAASVELYNDLRSRMAEVYRLKAGDLPVTYTEIHAMNVCSQVLPVELVVEELDSLLERVRTAAPTAGKGPRFLISGSVVTDDSIMAFLEERGARVVGDDTCLGLRLLEGRMPEGTGLEPLAEYYITRPPCSSRADFPTRRGHLIEVLEALHVDGVVFVHQKFCDPHLSDHPSLKRLLEERGVPSVQVETEGEGFTGQVQTRIEGFLEMLESR